MCETKDTQMLTSKIHKSLTCINEGCSKYCSQEKFCFPVIAIVFPVQSIKSNQMLNISSSYLRPCRLEEMRYHKQKKAGIRQNDVLELCLLFPATLDYQKKMSSHNLSSCSSHCLLKVWHHSARIISLIYETCSLYPGNEDWWINT